MRDERHLGAVLHAQVQQFFLGLEVALARRITEPLTKSRLLHLGLAVADEVGLEPDEGSPDLFEMFSFMRALAAYPFDAGYGAGFAPDGSITIMMGPDLPSLDEVGIGGAREHDARDLGTAIAIARECTRLAAELRVLLEWGRDAQDDDSLWAAKPHRPRSRSSAGRTQHAGSEKAETHDEQPTPVSFITELTSLAEEHFHVWWGGSESAWVRYALEVLAAGGLISARDDQTSRARSVARLITLWALLLEFNAHSGEGSPGDWAYEVGEWIDSGISLEELRLLNNELDLGWEFDDEEYEVAPSDVCADVVRAEHPAVADALTTELGESLLFASMWATRTETTYPLDGDQFNDIVNTDINGDKQQGYAWVDAGMPL